MREKNIFIDINLKKIKIFLTLILVLWLIQNFFLFNKKIKTWFYVVSYVCSIIGILTLIPIITIEQKTWLLTMIIISLFSIILYKYNIIRHYKLVCFQ